MSKLQPFKSATGETKPYKEIRLMDFELHELSWVKLRTWQLALGCFDIS